MTVPSGMLVSSVESSIRPPSPVGGMFLLVEMSLLEVLELEEIPLVEYNRRGYNWWSYNYRRGYAWWG